MRIARLSVDGKVTFAIVGNDATGMPIFHEMVGHPFGEVATTEQTWSLAQVRLLPPVLPSKVVCIGKNYFEHAAELDSAVPAEPLFFLKPSTSVIAPGEPIILPDLSDQVEHEAELALVIGRMCRNVSANDAHQVVLGVTAANDVTARDLQARDGQWTRAKGFDTFCPLGPWIDTDISIDDVTEPGLAVTCLVDDSPRQSFTTGDMVYGPRAIIAAVSAVMTLLPGDVILTGTGAGVGGLRHGDTVRVRLEGVGALTNPVLRREE